jgi:hypothetical protein
VAPPAEHRANSGAELPSAPTLRANWHWYALLWLSSFALYLWLCAPLIAHYYPTTDDIAIEAASTSLGGPIHPWDWIVHGFGDYFQPYPEWQSRPSNFFRPLFNAVFWGYYQVFGLHWSYQLVAGYLVHALAATLAAYLAVAVLGLSRIAALVAISIAILNPACWAIYPDTFAIPPVLQFPAYQIEILCALVMLLAFLAFVRSRFVLFAVCATLALLLKETALTLPIAALALSGVWLSSEPRRSVRNFLWLAAPLLIWLLIKLTLFQHGFSSFVMSSSKPWAWLTQPIRNALLWPTGLYTSALAQTAGALRHHHWGSIARYFSELGINTAWWLGIGVALLQIARRYGKRWLRTVPEAWVMALVFAGSNLLLLIALQETHLRYGYFWFALGPAALLQALARYRGATLMSLLGLGVLAIPIASISSTLSADSIHNYRLVKHAAQQLTALLATLPVDVDTVYLVDDIVVQIPSPKYMAKFSGYHGQIVLVNSIRPLPHCAVPPSAKQRYRLSVVGGATLLSYNAPACFEPYFGLPPLARIGGDNSVARGPWMTYTYPELAVERRSATADYSVGDAWTLRSTEPSCAMKGACVWLGFDDIAGEYFEIKP